MKKSFAIVALIACAFLANAQSNIRLNNYVKNTLHINPATVYDKYTAIFSMAGRMQWVGFDGAPKTLFATGTTYIDKFNTQLTLRLIQDKIGYTSSTQLTGAYAYALKLDRWSQLHLGVGGNLRSFSYDLSKVSPDNPDDEFMFDRLRAESSFNAEIGAEYATKYLKIGLSSQNFMSLFRSYDKLQINTNFLYLKYRQNSNTYVDMAGGLCAVQYNNLVQMEFALTAYFRTLRSSGLTVNPDLFDVGVYYRTRSEVGLTLGYNISDNLHVSYSYDYNFGDLRRSAYGTNEIVLTYSIKYKPECRTCWY